jgi:hypothetical protein
MIRISASCVISPLRRVREIGGSRSSKPHASAARPRQQWPRLGNYFSTLVPQLASGRYPGDDYPASWVDSMKIGDDKGKRIMGNLLGSSVRTAFL